MARANIHVSDDAMRAVILQVRINQLLTGLAKSKTAWEPPYSKDGHRIDDDYLEICTIPAVDIATNDAETRELVTLTAARWGIDISIKGVDNVDE